MLLMKTLKFFRSILSLLLVLLLIVTTSTYASLSGKVCFNNSSNVGVKIMNVGYFNDVTSHDALNNAVITSSSGTACYQLSNKSLLPKGVGVEFDMFIAIGGSQGFFIGHIIWDNPAVGDANIIIKKSNFTKIKISTSKSDNQLIVNFSGTAERNGPSQRPSGGGCIIKNGQVSC